MPWSPAHLHEATRQGVAPFEASLRHMLPIEAKIENASRLGLFMTPSGGRRWPRVTASATSSSTVCHGSHMGQLYGQECGGVGGGGVTRCRLLIMARKLFSNSSSSCGNNCWLQFPPTGCKKDSNHISLFLFFISFLFFPLFFLFFATPSTGFFSGSRRCRPVFRHDLKKVFTHSLHLSSWMQSGRGPGVGKAATHTVNIPIYMYVCVRVCVCVCVLIKICSRSQLEFVIWQRSRLISTDIVNKLECKRDSNTYIHIYNIPYMLDSYTYTHIYLIYVCALISANEIAFSDCN